jgi:hypothetical protein
MAPMDGHFDPDPIRRCRDAFWPILLEHVERSEPPMPFDPPCFAPEFFFDAEVLRILRGAMGDRRCGYRNPLFPECPARPLPPYMLVVSFGLG